MEFNEKLQELRKSKGLTQEELAEALFVSRTAISKWESGRGYPNIDSLKEISKFFSVSIDDLLSGEKLLSIAEKENNSNMRGVCNSLFGLVDLFSVILIILPLYPNTVDGFVYSVNLLNYTQIAHHNKVIFWVAFVLLILVGVSEIVMTRLKYERSSEILMEISTVINVLIVIFLALTREAYAVVVALFLLIIKVAILLKKLKSCR